MTDIQVAGSLDFVSFVTSVAQWDKEKLSYIWRSVRWKLPISARQGKGSPLLIMAGQEICDLIFMRCTTLVQTRVGKYRPSKRSGLITSAKQHNMVASYDRGGFVAPRAHSCVFLSYPRPHKPGSLHLAHFSSTPETFLPQVKLITQRRLHPELSFD